MLRRFFIVLKSFTTTMTETVAAGFTIRAGHEELIPDANEKSPISSILIPVPDLYSLFERNTLTPKKTNI